MANKMAHLLYACLVLAILPSAARAVQLREKPISEMVRESDVIMVGRVDEDSANTDGSQAHVRVSLVYGIKGGQDLDFIYRTGIREMDPVCCRKNGIYLLFLRRQPSGMYSPVGGRQGVIEVEAQDGT